MRLDGGEFCSEDVEVDSKCGTGDVGALTNCIVSSSSACGIEKVKSSMSRGSGEGAAEGAGGSSGWVGGRNVTSCEMTCGSRCKLERGLWIVDKDGLSKDMQF